jgi:AAA domain
VRYKSVPEPIDLCHGFGDAQRVLSHIAYDPALVLIAIDTLSRALAGGDENGSRDMGQFVINCDQMRQQTGAHVCVLHHLGKDESRGARGHSLLKAALDTEITVSTTGRVGFMEVTKQRDYPHGEIFGFASKSVDLGDGKTSFVVVPGDVPKKRPTRQRLNPKHELARRALSVLASGSKGKPAPSDWGLPPYVTTVEVDLWRDELFNTGVLDKDGKRARQGFWETKRALAAKSVIGEREGVVWLRDAPSIIEGAR